MTRSASTAVLNIRVSAAERMQLEAAARYARTSLSDFVRRKAVEGAEAELLKRSVVAIPATEWEKFETWLDRPAKAGPALRELASRVPIWKD